MRSDDVYLYQCQAWAEFTGDADYDQPFQCDYVNHTLTAPSDDECLNCVTILCYFSDVTEAHGPMHYVTRTDSASIAGPEATLHSDAFIATQPRAARTSRAPRTCGEHFSVQHRRVSPRHQHDRTARAIATR